MSSPIVLTEVSELGITVWDTGSYSSCDKAFYLRKLNILKAPATDSLPSLNSETIPTQTTWS